MGVGGEGAGKGAFELEHGTNSEVHFATRALKEFSRYFPMQSVRAAVVGGGRVTCDTSVIIFADSYHTSFFSVLQTFRPNLGMTNFRR